MGPSSFLVAALAALFLSDWASAVPPGFVEDLVAMTEYSFTNTGAFTATSNGDSLLFLGSKLGQIYAIVNPDDNPQEQHLLLDLPVCTNGNAECRQYCHILISRRMASCTSIELRKLITVLWITLLDPRTGCPGSPFRSQMGLFR
jgi:hypothetical protein